MTAGAVICSIELNITLSHSSSSSTSSSPPRKGSHKSVQENKFFHRMDGGWVDGTAWSEINFTLTIDRKRFDILQVYNRTSISCKHFEMF